MAEIGMAAAQRRLNRFGRRRVWTDQRHDQSVMTRAKPPQMQVGYTCAKFTLDHQPDLLRKIRIRLRVEQHKTTVAYQTESP